MSSQVFTIYLEGEEAMVAFGRRLGGLLTAGVIYLHGDLGAGKTTLARGILRARGYAGAVKSPTFTLVQSYDLPQGTAHHFDLYRLSGPAGLMELGWDEAREGIVLVEWPDRLGALAPADALTIRLAPGMTEEARQVTITGWDAKRAGLLA